MWKAYLMLGIGRSSVSPREMWVHYCWDMWRTKHKINCRDEEQCSIQHHSHSLAFGVEVHFGRRSKTKVLCSQHFHAELWWALFTEMEKWLLDNVIQPCGLVTLNTKYGKQNMRSPKTILLYVYRSYIDADFCNFGCSYTPGMHARIILHCNSMCMIHCSCGHTPYWQYWHYSYSSYEHEYRHIVWDSSYEARRRMPMS